MQRYNWVQYVTENLTVVSECIKNFKQVLEYLFSYELHSLLALKHTIRD